MEDKNILLIGNNKIITGMFTEVIINEIKISGDKKYNYNIPTMAGMVIMIANDTGSHNSGRIKVGKSTIKNAFSDKSKYYEVYYSKGSVIFVGGDKSGLEKRKPEIEDFYVRNKEILQSLKNSKNIDSDEIYSIIKNTEYEYLNNL